MKQINIDVLKRGDIVLTTSTEKVSGIIRSSTRSDISHAMICVAEASVIDSTNEGVQARNIQKLFYEDSCAIYVLRLKVPIPSEQINNIIRYARESTGTSYTVREAMASVAPGVCEKGSRKQFCSRMVARAYDSVGIKLVSNPDFCTPNDLKKSKLLKMVDNPWVLVIDEELEATIPIVDSTIGMREVTNSLLVKVRALDSSVESLNDIEMLLLQRPELDEPIAQAFCSSGYLDHWKVETSRFPWRYDPVLIAQFYHSLPDPTQLLNYCRDTLFQDQNGDFSHWEINAKAYRDLYEIYQYETFRLLHDLYLRLTIQHTVRVKCAKMLIDVYANPKRT